MTGLYWEDWKVGAQYRTNARTVTEADLAIYTGLSGDYHPLHTDEEYCRKTAFGSRIAQGPLVNAISAGLLYQLHLYDDTALGFLGFDRLRFTAPVKPGDTIHARIEVLEVIETSKSDRGVVKRLLQVLNQRGELVQEGVQAFLIKRRPVQA